MALILLFASVLYSCNPDKEANYSEPAMFMVDEVHSGKHESMPVKNKPSILWKVKTEGQVISSPIISNNVVFVGSSEQNLYAIDAFTGDIIWAYKTEGSINSTPLVVQGKVMFLSYDGYFYALDQTSGELSWKFKTGGEKIFEVKDYYNSSFEPDFWDFYLSSAITKDSLVYFGSSDSNLYALNINSGERCGAIKQEEAFILHQLLVITH